MEHAAPFAKSNLPDKPAHALSRTMRRRALRRRPSDGPKKSRDLRSPFGTVTVVGCDAADPQPASLRVRHGAMPITIAHLSDLHFGTPNQAVVWRSLAEYFRQHPPDLYLVTGDIVDTPKRALFEQAKAALDHLPAKHPQRYLVCPGNHDRHWKGNATGWFKSWLWPFAKHFAESAWFAETFVRHVATVGGHDIVLGEAANQWTLRIAGLDTSIDARYAAQGYVVATELQRLRGLSGQSDHVDAIFLLAHHHLLPIAEAEGQDQPITGLANGTTVRNAGSVLGAIVSSHVNLVLHGHEHARNIARFGTLDAWGGETVVIGSGSSTGMVTNEGCKENAASSNVIELRDDQSIWVRELRFSAGQWRLLEPAICLCSPTRTRQHSFFRSAGAGRARPTSVATKSVVFNHHRDVDVRLSYSDWTIEDREIELRVQSLTGVPLNPKIELDLVDGRSASNKTSVGFADVAGKRGHYVFRHALDRDDVVATRARVSYLWVGGALLCNQDLMIVDPGLRHEFRARGLEFATFEVVSNLRSFRLSVQLPEHFRIADVADVDVYVEPIDGGSPPERAPDLKSAIDHDGSGLITLYVEYPWRNWRYYLVWPLPSVDIDSTATEELRAQLSDKAANAVEAFYGSLSEAAWAPHASVALYIPEHDGQRRVALRCLATCSGTFAVDDVPEHFLLGLQYQPFVQAWWGSLGVMTSRGSAAGADFDVLEAGMVDGERWMFVVAVRDLAAPPGFAPAALLRVGVAFGVDALGLSPQDVLPEFSDALKHGVIALLHELRS